MKIAFDVDVLAKQMDINRMVHQVADWGYKYIEQSPHPRINPFYKHPLVRTYRGAETDGSSQLETDDRDRRGYGRAGNQHGAVWGSQPAGDLQRHVVPFYGRTSADH